MARLYREAVETELGIRVDDNWSRYRHVTDSGILNEIMGEADGTRDRPLAYARIKKAFVQTVADHIGARRGRMPEIVGGEGIRREAQIASRSVGRRGDGEAGGRPRR